MAKDITFQCSHCKKIMHTVAENEGKTASCPKCKQKTKIHAIQADNNKKSVSKKTKQSTMVCSVFYTEIDPISYVQQRDYESPLLEISMQSIGFLVHKEKMTQAFNLHDRIKISIDCPVLTYPLKTLVTVGSMDIIEKHQNIYRITSEYCSQNKQLMDAITQILQYIQTKPEMWEHKR